jgi:hypothetical protein
MGVPLIITEFGACTEKVECAEEIKNVANAADNYLVGWTYWQYKKFGDLTTSVGDKASGFYEADGTLRDGKIKAIARTYLQATQGTLKALAFNSVTGRFVGSFIADSSI